MAVRVPGRVATWAFLGGLLGTLLASAAWAQAPMPGRPACLPEVVPLGPPPPPAAAAPPAPAAPSVAPVAPAPSAAAGAATAAQPPVPPETSFAAGGSTIALADSAVGYIDSALVRNTVRVRYDLGYDFRRPDRNEFFYAKGGSGGNGLPNPETGVDFQELSAAVEYKLREHCSAIVEFPFRFLNPEQNANEAGFSDMSLGFKYAFRECPDYVETFQFRVYLPTGDSERGLGNNHLSVEPGLLLWERLCERWTLEVEFRGWFPIDDTDFGGPVVRYGLGLGYQWWTDGRYWLTPVGEVVGWTFFDGKKSITHPNGLREVKQVHNDNVLNGKIGLRAGSDRGDLFIGYGRALTGNSLYENILRIEVRFAY
jgi:hypothetical protein